ncbi:nuclear transport factor 2 family protein [Ectopseudomonas mendocina]|uniref:Nuclear transport factor 2 family protein n=1 Tax=Ectopseudomonas mendocina TaxID=300 RepID=A0ABZ2RM22_ECTME
MPLTRLISAAVLACTLLSTGLSHATETARDLKQEEANRALVLSFYDQFFNKHQIAEAAKVLTDDYRQHNPHVPDGKAPMVSYFTEFFKSNPKAQAKVVRSATDGDLVYLHVHFTNGPDDRGQALVDIFRVENNRITEHWDVIQDVPETAANDNTMF